MHTAIGGILRRAEQFVLLCSSAVRYMQIFIRTADSESVALFYSAFSLLRRTLSMRTKGTLGRAKRLLIQYAQKKNPFFKEFLVHLQGLEPWTH